MSINALFVLQEKLTLTLSKLIKDLFRVDFFSMTGRRSERKSLMKRLLTENGRISYFVLTQTIRRCDDFNMKSQYSSDTEKRPSDK